MPSRKPAPPQAWKACEDHAGHERTGPSRHGRRPGQNGIAETAIENAVLVAIGLSSLCEMAWVLKRHYGVDRADIANAIRSLTGASNVVSIRLAVEAGLSVLDAGGDFADGVIAYEGGSLGGETFVSFDRMAVKLLNADGRAAELLR